MISHCFWLYGKSHRFVRVSADEKGQLHKIEQFTPDHKRCLFRWMRLPNRADERPDF